jgi:UDP-N-acetylglucosamine diphosphorylase/glucosamine-1-phosphate N-acetyltransferase
LNTTVVLFEDHTWHGLRPLASSLSTYEQRCGIFNTRERVELLRTPGAMGSPGVLLGRSYLEALRGESPWAPGIASLGDAGSDSSPPQLWLTGRLAPAMPLVNALLALPEDSPPFEWRDEDGLVAALLTPAQGRLAAASWDAWRDGRTSRWSASALGAAVQERPAGDGQKLTCAGDAAGDAADDLAAYLSAASNGLPPALRHAWDIVPATAAALVADLQVALGAGGWTRRPFALFAADVSEPAWAGRTELRRCGQGDLPPGVWLLGDDFHQAAGVTLAPGVVIDARRGPVVLDRGCDVASHTLLEGPLYLGPGCRVKAGARLYGESSFGVGNRLAGEIGESTFGDFANKQHEGFIGHTVLGSWTNLGAMTTCSDLKNNYGTVRVDLGEGQVATGQRFVGLLAGDHVKTAIGTLFNTGTCVGFASNIFGGGMPPKFVPPFSWGGSAGAPGYGVEQAVATAAVVMSRRQCLFLPAHRTLFETLSPTA